MTKTNRLEYEYILEIADRALPLYADFGLPDDKLTITMDLDFAHECYPIDLFALLKADESTFVHDVFGIRRHMNRRTKKLEGCFVPRTALAE
jgi:hypothetical protein